MTNEPLADRATSDEPLYQAEPVYEVFIKKDGKDEFRHAGSLNAANDTLAMVMARETYLRRAEGNRVWVVRREHVLVGDDDFVGPNADKAHRHHDGAAVAARRKSRRDDQAVQEGQAGQEGQAAQEGQAGQEGRT